MMRSNVDIGAEDHQDKNLSQPAHLEIDRREHKRRRVIVGGSIEINQDFAHIRGVVGNNGPNFAMKFSGRIHQLANEKIKHNRASLQPSSGVDGCDDDELSLSQQKTPSNSRHLALTKPVFGKG